MATLTVENQSLTIPDCSAGGDHLTVAQEVLKVFENNHRVISNSRRCTDCNLWVNLSFNGNPPSWEIDLEDLDAPSDF